MGVFKMTEQKRSKEAEQLATVKKVLLANNIDIEDAGAARTLYQSCIQAKGRAGTAKGYEDREYLLNPEPRRALIQVINEEPDLWKSWIVQQKHYKESGYDDDFRPTLHRIDSKGNYEVGNIAMLPMGKHLQEHAVKTTLIKFTKNGLGIHQANSIKEMTKYTGESYNILKSLEGQGIEFHDGENGMYLRDRTIAPDSEEAITLRGKWESPEVKALQEQWESVFGEQEKQR